MKRLLDIVGSACGLVLLAPAFIVVAVAVRLESPGPAFFRQERVGRNGRPFRITKFRTMHADAERSGLQLTAGDDPRITRVGRVLRRYKLDELPQLFDVLLGNMSLVGPRPEVPRYVAMYDAAARARILSVRPGITDPASIDFIEEEELLRGGDVESAYVNVVLPQKVQRYLRYIDERSLLLDLKIIGRTLTALLRRDRSKNVTPAP